MLNELSMEYQFLVSNILQNGKEVKGRNGKTLMIPHASFTIDFSKTGPVLKLRKMYTKGIKGEFYTIIDQKPLRHVDQFKANGCNYWGLWADENGALRLDYHDELVKQLPGLIECIKNDPNSRRHVIDLWNPENVQNRVLSLECCWYSHVYTVIDGTLHMHWIQRSVDTMVGLPSDIYLAYLFMEYIAECADLKIGTCRFSLSNVHIYVEHLDGAKEIMRRDDSYYNEPIKFELKA